MGRGTLVDTVRRCQPLAAAVPAQPDWRCDCDRDDLANGPSGLDQTDGQAKGRRMILHLYFARRFIMGFILISAVLFSLLVLVDMVDQARRFGSYDIGWLRLFGMTLLKTPE